jgi:hypothetical protein
LNVAPCAIPGLMWAANSSERAKVPGCACDQDADHLITVWNERQAKRMPMLFSDYWFLRARCPACRTTGDVDLRALDWHRGAAVTALTPALSCRSRRPNTPFAELVCLSKSSVAERYYTEGNGDRWVS